MAHLLRLFIVLFLLVGGVGFVLFQAIRFLGLTRWSTSRRTQEKKQGIEIAKSQLENPVQWTIKEMDLLSLSYDYKFRKGIFSSTVQGQFSTIFGEDYIGFYIKEYSAQEFLLCFSTHETDFILLQSTKQASITVNGREIGRYHHKKVLNSKGEVLGELKSGSAYTSILVDNVDVAHLETWTGNASENTRAFQLVEEKNMKTEWLPIVTVLTVMHLLESDVLM